MDLEQKSVHKFIYKIEKGKVGTLAPAEGSDENLSRSNCFS